MRILHVYKDYHPILGGIENHLRAVARTQAERGHDVTVLVTNPAGRSTSVREEEGVRVIRASRLATVASTPLSLALFRQLRRQEPDVVHLHFPYPLGEVSQWLLLRGRATVLTYHSDVIKQAGILKLYHPLLKRILRSVDRIIATSEPYVQSSPYLRSVADRCTVIPLGIDIDRFARPQPQNVQMLRARYPGPLLLFVGRLRYYKGLDYLIEAMKQIDATLLVVGTGPEAANLGDLGLSRFLTPSDHKLDLTIIEGGMSFKFRLYHQICSLEELFSRLAEDYGGRSRPNGPRILQHLLWVELSGYIYGYDQVCPHLPYHIHWDYINQSSIGQKEGASLHRGEDQGDGDACP